MILLDTHVHLYHPQDLSRLLHCAHQNFKTIAKGFGDDLSYDAVVCLTQTAKSLSVIQLLDIVHAMTDSSAAFGDWQVHMTKEKVSLEMRALDETRDKHVIFLIGGQQIVSCEKLEVLSIGNQIQISDGMSLAETLLAVEESGGIPIIPWGVGKWLGQRGKIVKKLIMKESKVHYFLGDNSARPKCWPYVHLFNMARKKGIEILNGSDPLNFTSEIVKPGSFGVALPSAEIESQHPAKKIKELLLDRHQIKNNYGTPQSLRSFVSSQLRLNLNRLGRGITEYK